MKVEAVIEIPMGTRNKYEVDHKTGKIKLDRVLYSSVSYPCEYGYIPDTLSGDGDPLDILVLSTSATFPGCIVKARVLGYLEILDRGETDEKLISVVDTDPRWDHIHKLDDLPEHTMLEIREFFKTYKHLQNIEVKVGNIYGVDEARLLLQECKDRYEE